MVPVSPSGFTSPGAPHTLVEDRWGRRGSRNVRRDRTSPEPRQPGRLKSCEPGLHPTWRAARRYPCPVARLVLKGVGILTLLLLASCSPKTKIVPIQLSLDTKATPDPSGRLILLASGYTCGDKLEVTTSVNKSSKTITVSGSGPVPDNENGYCYRYIDTGGSGTESTTRAVPVELDDGQWTVRSERGGEDADGQIEVIVDGSSIKSSTPWRTFEQKTDEAAAEAAMEPHRQATEAVANALSTAWLPEWPRDPVCTVDPGAPERYFTTCTLGLNGLGPDGHGSLILDVGQTPMPPEVLEAVGCSSPRTSEPIDGPADWVLTCELAGEVAPGWTLEVRGDPLSNRREGQEDGWYWEDVEILLR